MMGVDAIDPRFGHYDGGLCGGEISHTKEPGSAAGLSVNDEGNLSGARTPSMQFSSIVAT
jgi:hypothetical protein